MMRSVCKNCCHSQRDGQHLFCAKRMKYVRDSYKCKYFAEGRDGDIDNAVYLAFAIIMIVLGIAITILTNI
jgi:hypothetical protein